MIKIFHSDRFVPELPEGHRFPIQKYQLIREQLLYEGSIQDEMLEESQEVAEEDILLVHTADYWERMKTLSLTAREVRKMGFPQSERLVERSRRSCQGTLSAALWAKDHGLGMNIAGGTHHAYPDHGEGFCLLNDIAISIRHLQNHHSVKNILIIDLDVHQGNGNSVIFHDDPNVFTFSMHGKDNYPFKKETSDLDISLASGLDDQAYLDQLENSLSHILSQFTPDFIFFQAGVDVLESDKLGKLSLSKDGLRRRDLTVLHLCKKLETPLCVSIGGGYSSRLVDTVEGHSQTFRLALDVFR